MKHTVIASVIGTLLIGGAAIGSSHREAPMITKTPKVDATDFYMFRSYESGREGYVTFLANYLPLQDPYGGPNYFTLDDRALYGIHIDSDGDGLSENSFYFRFYNSYRNLTVPVGDVDVAIPLNNIGPFGSPRMPQNRNLWEQFALINKTGAGISVVQNLSRGDSLFFKPHDNIGNKSIPNYDSYAARYVADIGVDGCATPGRVFVGQRQESFSANLGEIFDLVNTNPLGPPDGEENVLADKNVTTIALELPIACITEGSNPIIGAWTAAYLSEDGHLQEVSRLSAPLVNELVIGLPDKDNFNRSRPYYDAQFAQYVTNPTLPILIETLFPAVEAPTVYPREDLVAAFLTGIEGLNQPANVRPAEMMRLNTSIAPKPAADQETLGVLAGDTAGFPNGRRPGDDVVDITLRVAMGVLLPEADAPSGQLPYTDGAPIQATDFRDTFPYLNTPIPGSPNEAD